MADTNSWVLCGWTAICWISSPSKSSIPTTCPTTAGQPQPIASINATGNPSWSPLSARTKGATKSVACWYIWGNWSCERAPKKLTFFPRFNRSTCCFNADSSGPNPTIFKRNSGCSFTKIAKASNKKLSPFFGTNRPTKSNSLWWRFILGFGINRCCKSTPIGITSRCWGRMHICDK